jgi:cysteine sulfinate desulfinase/cysteine desulfurase-like protein
LKGSSGSSDTASSSSGVKRHIVTTQTEHKCVLDSCRSLEQEGYDVTYLPVEKATGLIDMELLESSLREDTLLVSIMAVNNEIGTRQPLEDIGKMCRKKKILFHTDGEHMRLIVVLFSHRALITLAHSLLLHT